MHSDIIFCCRICGYKSADPPWGEDGHSPIYDFCPCCGVEHGYQDSTPVGAQKYRIEWIAAGAKWEEPDVKPDDWSLDEQLNHVPHEFQ